MKILSGAELAGYVKERQAKQVRNLRQEHKVFPRLAIIQTVDDAVIDTYVRLKKNYGKDILVDVDVYRLDETSALAKIAELNSNSEVHGIIVQLPLGDVDRTDELLASVKPEKDVDALGPNALLDPATPTAINWLMAGYGIDLVGRKIVIIGNGRLVGAPLARMWQSSGFDVTVIDRPSVNLASVVRASNVVVSAVGSPGLVTSDMLRPETVVVDAATATENGKIVGDIADDVRRRHDLTITPEKGGVGPLTVCALFDNVIRVARQATTS